ncbi:indolethylamine N-methyltransferase-like [Hyla sarda]|uniref:indolethylamine N-methyltransferase-like n=1 Tax=Hyla sarda TaxID=327740 RepID=UPI0024C3AACF|nr:indolethylamine N-methyltransferase-like [Hyla sarda]
MDSCDFKFYHEDGFDSRQFLEDYFSDKNDMAFRDDTLVFPIENLKKIFKGGQIKGDVLIDLSIGPIAHNLFAACEFFKYVIALKDRYTCIMELKRWLDTRTGAFYWGHAMKLHVGMEENSDQLQEKEEEVKSDVAHVVKCDLEQENIMDPMVLPLADCIISAWLLDAVCKDQDDYRRYLRKFSRMLKPGGHLILIGDLEKTYYTVGDDKMKTFTYDENFARKALVGEGFAIDNCVTKKASGVSDLTDYKGVIFIAAHKE